jgi:hypothetical protein
LGNTAARDCEHFLYNIQAAYGGGSAVSNGGGVRLSLGDKILQANERAYLRLRSQGRVDQFPQIIAEAIGTASEPLVAELKRRAPEMLREHAELRADFEQRLASHWGQALDLYEMIMVACEEAGAEYNSANSEAAEKENDLVFEALVGLHALACRTASEIYALLRSGHPFGAMTRWRSIHENAVVAEVLSVNGSGVAERFLLHQHLQNAKDARSYQDHYEALGYEPLSQEEFAQIQQTADDLKARYGKEYQRDYGWAAILTNDGRAPFFRDLERMAGLEHLRPFYGWASHAVHPGSKGLQLNLLQRGEERVRLAGPTNAFLTDPGHGALQALLHVTTVLLIHGRQGSAQHLEHLIAISALTRLVDEAGDAFLQAERDLEIAEAQFQAELREPSGSG